MASVAKEWREIPGRYNLRGTKCGSCGKVFFPSRSFCPVCRRESIGKVEDYKLDRHGEVYSFSVVHEAPESCSMLKPYAVVMVRNRDGVLLSGQMVDVDVDAIEIGMPVRAVLRKLDADGLAGVIHYGFKFTPDL
ncbi:MAG: Zn-ribbon domain-containing OB-fold protein [Euryarchaeota archaeon]|nr:Zn-ribbon domain-containing OB-fold protein [Euryarchaeota archaeon]